MNLQWKARLGVDWEILDNFSANLSMLLDEDMLNTTKMGKDLNMTDITELLRPGLRCVVYRHLLLQIFTALLSFWILLTFCDVRYSSSNCPSLACGPACIWIWIWIRLRLRLSLRLNINISISISIRWSWFQFRVHVRKWHTQWEDIRFWPK